MKDLILACLVVLFVVALVIDTRRALRAGAKMQGGDS